jgi:hypothetical protein
VISIAMFTSCSISTGRLAMTLEGFAFEILKATDIWFGVAGSYRYLYCPRHKYISD